MDDPTTPPAAARCEFPRPEDLMRDADRWAKTNAETVSEGSRAQVIHCIRDAQHDIAELTREVRMWRTIGSRPGFLSPATHAAALRVVEAARVFRARYIEFIDSGDCGFWDPREEKEVRAVTEALAAFDAAKGGDRG